VTGTTAIQRSENISVSNWVGETPVNIETQQANLMIMTESNEVNAAITRFNLNENASCLFDSCNAVNDPQALRNKLIELLESQEQVQDTEERDYSRIFIPLARSRIVEQYSRENSLSEPCSSLLRLLNPEVLTEVLNSFEPGDDDFNIALNNYAAQKKAAHNIRSVSKDSEKKSQKDFELGPEVLTFTQQWNLNEQSVKLLQSIPQEVLQDVMANFHPRDVSRDVNPVFASFVKSRLYPKQVYYAVEGYGGQQSLKLQNFNTVNPAPMWNPAPPQTPMQVMPSWTTPQPEQQWTGQQQYYGNDEFYAINAFVQQWNLDASAAALLRSFPHAVLYDIIAYFNPKDVTRDVNKIFHSFARSRASSVYPATTGATPDFSQNNESQPHQQPTQLPTLLFSADDNNQNTQQPPNPGYSHQYDEMELFISYWGLNPTATKLLQSIPYDQQCEVMNNFSPKDVSRDVNPLFIAFAKSRLTTGSKVDRREAELYIPTKA